MPERFLFECAMKLAIKPLTSATAAVLFHRFFKEADESEYDPYVSTSWLNPEVFDWRRFPECDCAFGNV